jgi:hypothetical protein
LKDKELILRYLALNEDYGSYQRPMGDFLTTFMKKYSDASGKVLTKFADNFNRSLDCIYSAIGTKAFKPQRAVNAANFDAIMVGVTKNINNVCELPDKELRRIYNNLLADDAFQAYTQKSTADEASVKGRIELAIKAFSK